MICLRLAITRNAAWPVSLEAWGAFMASLDPCGIVGGSDAGDPAGPVRFLVHRGQVDVTEADRDRVIAPLIGAGCEVVGVLEEIMPAAAEARR